MKRRIMVIGAALTLALAGCSSGDSGGSTGGSGDSEPIVVAQGDAPTTFKPNFATTSHVFLYSLYDTLVRLDDTGEPQPDLATDWTTSEDGRTVTFTMRPDVKFSDGSPLTAQDIAFTLNWVLDPANAQDLQARYEPIIASVEATDDLTVVFTLKQAAPGLFDMLDQTLIVNEEKLADIETGGAGSGPYTLTDSTEGVSYTLEANPNYWAASEVKIPSIEVRVMKDREAQYNALTAGEVDMIYAADDLTSQRASGASGIEVQQASLGAVNPYVMVNVDRPPFDNKLVRQAIALAVNRDAMIEVAYPGGSVKANCQPYSSTSWAYDEDLDLPTCTYDLDKAKELLARAGFPNGFETSINVSGNYGPPGSSDMAQILQADLAKIGITLKVNPLEAGVARDQLLNSDFDMVMHSYSAANTDPTFYIPSRTFGPTDPPSQAFSHFSSPQFVQLVAGAGSTLDRARRTDLYHQIAQLMSDESFIDVIGNGYVLYVKSDKLDGIVPGAAGWPDFTHASMSG